MGMQRCALVTGGSGFLGSYVVRDLLAEGFDRVVVLMRGGDSDECEQRLRSLWWERQELVDEVGGRIQVVCGDVCAERMGLAPDAYGKLAAQVTHIVHAAAEIGVNETAQRFGEVNVEGTLNVLLFAEAAARAGALERLVHVSTAYVAGMREGGVLEDELVDAGFNSLYEQSKFGAEQLVHDAGSRIPASIVRPAQIVGDSKTGFVATFNTLYYPLKLYLKGQLPVLPVSAAQKLNMVPVDYVSRMVVCALLEPSAEGKTFHAVVPADCQPTAGEMLEAVREWARDNLQFDPGTPRFVPAPAAARLGRVRNLAPSDAPKRKSIAQNMLALAPYFSENRTYDTANAQELVGAVGPDWRTYLPGLLAYAVRKGFLNHTGRTVFQQMLVRLSSKRNTISYYDVTSDG
ncbi:MAG: SDR family oxidoreductase, partial [Eggerthellaceae bacterium]|nr:SDR family oxidoreductase [Eggerthellaceae bacterium]